MPVRVLALLAVSAATLEMEAPLRSGCGDDETTIATLPAGQPVEVKSALSGGSGTCYKVVVQWNGQTLSGYVAAKVVKGRDSFDQARREAKSLGAGGSQAQPNTQAQTIMRQASAKSGKAHPATKAWELIEANQPAEALRLLENDLLRYPMDPYLHAVAGMAYYRLDNLDRAILHWKESTQLEANDGIASLIERAQREKGADHGSERMVGARIVLRYEKSALTQPYALAMLQVLDEEYSRVSATLGCRATEKVTAIAQTRETYFQSTRAAEWSGGQYDGRIHIPVTESRQVPAHTRQVFAHELVHACLHELGQWPSWLHEGLAQKFSGASQPAAQRATIEKMLKARQLPKLSALGNGWGGMTGAGAGVAYSYAFYAAEKLLELKANTGLGNVLRNPGDFSTVESELEKALGW